MKLLFLVMTIVLFSSCSPTKFFVKGFHTEMTEVIIDEKKAVEIDKGGKYIDDSIELAVMLNSKNPRFLGFGVRNKTDKPITIDWYSVSLITKNGQSIKLRTRGDINRTMIPPHSYILEVNHTYIYDRSKLFPYFYTKDVTVLNSWIKHYIGQEFTLYLPLTYEGSKTIYYKAKVVIDSVDVLQHNPDTKYDRVNTLPNIIKK